MENLSPSCEDWWRVVEIYGVHRLVGGIEQIVARERTHGPYTSLYGAEQAKRRMEGAHTSRERVGEIPGMFHIEKGRITWQET